MKLSLQMGLALLLVSQLGCAMAKVTGFDNSANTVEVEINSFATMADAKAEAAKHCRRPVKLLKMGTIVTGSHSTSSYDKVGKGSIFGNSSTENTTNKVYTFKCL